MPVTVGQKLRDIGMDARGSGSPPMEELVRSPPSRQPASAARPTLPRRAIRGIDWLQRRAQRVFEFSASGDCLLRLAIVRADRDVRLADGTSVARGKPVAALHLWNEHLPAIPPGGPTFAWVNRIRRQMVGSLAVLADRAETAPELRGIPAYRARIAFAPRDGRATMERLAARFGFERVPVMAPPPLGQRVHDFFDNFWMWGLLWTFNPEGLAHQSFFRERDEYWISRAVLLDRYGRRSSSFRHAAKVSES